MLKNAHAPSYQRSTTQWMENHITDCKKTIMSQENF